GVASRWQRAQPAALTLCDPLVDTEDRWRDSVVGLVRIHSDDDALARLDFALIAIGGILDLALRVPALDRGERAAELIDLSQVLPHAALDVGRHLLDRIRPAERVRRRRDVRLEGDDLLRAQRDARRLFRRQA